MLKEEIVKKHVTVSLCDCAIPTTLEVTGNILHLYAGHACCSTFLFGSTECMSRHC